MNAKDTYEAISYASPERLKDLAERCLKGSEAEVKTPPRPVLVMARVRETVDGEVFNLGEVLMTSCEVLLNGEPGWGMVMGHDPEKALCAAVIDATSRAPGRIPGDVEEELNLQRAFALEARRQRWAEVRPTLVEFEEMD